MDRTEEKRAHDYRVAGDSVTLINTLVAKSSLTTEDKVILKRNTDHLKVMVAKTDWGSDQPLTAFNKAISDGEAKL